MMTVLNSEILPRAAMMSRLLGCHISCVSRGSRRPLLMLRGPTLILLRPRFASGTGDSHIDSEERWKDFGKYFDFPEASKQSDFSRGNTVTIRGYIGKIRSVSSNLAFAPLIVDNGPAINLVLKGNGAEKLDSGATATATEDGATELMEGCTPNAGPLLQVSEKGNGMLPSMKNPIKSDSSSSSERQGSVLQTIKEIPKYSPISVTGVLKQLQQARNGNYTKKRGLLNASQFPHGTERLTVEVTKAKALNLMPKDIIVSSGVQFPSTDRNLQLRFKSNLRIRMKFRDYLVSQTHRRLRSLGFMHVDTPILFKSTPEGAREFLVPTRHRGEAYALPQSPQQYKQVLIAGGFARYFQLAKCFRDEDARADRQPEFTQLDMECAFANGEDVMQFVEIYIKKLIRAIRRDWGGILKAKNGGFIPVEKNSVKSAIEYPGVQRSQPFRRITYEESMRLFGIDKPDLRIPNEICRIDSITADAFVQMVTKVQDPIVEACRFRLESDLVGTRKFVDSFMDGLPLSLKKHPDGAPTILMYDPMKPLCGLSSMGHECALNLLGDSPEWSSVSPSKEGDIILIQARANESFSGGSTVLGTARCLLYQKAVTEGLLPQDLSWRFLWVTDFHLFRPEKNDDAGQGGQIGLRSTHHPFTAPKTSEDFELMHTEPLKAKADHYDLVLNGVELGGGSRRIHICQMQEYVMRHILRMTDERIREFGHLLKALKAGCPPHAGFALGFDRLAGLLSGTGSIRDVIAFPKTMKGEDLFAGSPGHITAEQLETYHLKLTEDKRKRHAKTD